ncbi:hypothetical protein B0H16DRAFT_1555557 [Mycena metata]|uniref:Uncharacterized protein n=1 Tax=Mycena metata TaxID=1033252 RepID=A0AAD7N6B3_9AGAR|nr:hypothetical protein B0H16DRAFT_1555557 [Mycena metata]
MAPRFPCRMPADQPPLLKGELVDGHPTPSYVLAWVCRSKTLYRNLGGGKLGEVDDRNFSDVISGRWAELYDFGYPLAPMPYPRGGDFYLIAIFNRPNTDHLTRVRDVANDPLIQAARVSMGVDLDQSLESTLMWYRWPLSAEERERRKEDLVRLQQRSR